MNEKGGMYEMMENAFFKYANQEGSYLSDEMPHHQINRKIEVETQLCK